MALMHVFMAHVGLLIETKNILFLLTVFGMMKVRTLILDGARLPVPFYKLSHLLVCKLGLLPRLHRNDLA